jgi:hypothetical protein
VVFNKKVQLAANLPGIVQVHVALVVEDAVGMAVAQHEIAEIFFVVQQVAVAVELLLAVFHAVVEIEVLDVSPVERYGFGQVQFFFVSYVKPPVDVLGEVAVEDTIKLEKILLE